MSQTITGFTPNVFTFANATTLSLTGTNLNLPATSGSFWIQFRSTADQSAVSAQNNSVVVPPSSSPTSATVTIPANLMDSSLYADSYAVWFVVATPGVAWEDLPWHSNSVKFPPVFIFDILAGGDMVPAAGGRVSAISLINVREQAIATVTIAPTANMRKTSWDPNIAGAPVSVGVQASLEIIDAASGTGLIPFTVPKLSWEGERFFFPPAHVTHIHSAGVWAITIVMTVTDPDTGNTYSSLPIPVPGPGLISYSAILGSQTDIKAPSVPTMGLCCSFSATNTAPDSVLNQHLRNNTGDWPQWLLDQPTDYTQANGYGDLFVWTDDVDANGNTTPFFIDGVPHYLLDEAGFSIQLLDLNGSGHFTSGSPIAIRVYDAVKGWRCARMDVNNLTYSQVGQYPTRWVVDAESKEYPSRPEELFGIFQLVANANYVPNDDQGNFNRGAAPCLIETQATNLINFGIDKVIIVPGAFTSPIDPYFVASTLPTAYLLPPATPPQSLVWGAGGFTDGFLVDASVYSVYFIGYINYVTPTDAMAAAKLGPSLNPGELISATCLGSTGLVNPANSSDKYLLMVASDPAFPTRPQNLFYSMYLQGQTPPSWQPLMPNAVAFNTNGISGQVSIVQIPGSTTVLLFQKSAPTIAVLACTINFSTQTLQPPAPTTASPSMQPSGAIILQSTTVAGLVTSAYSLRFGVTPQDINILTGSRFNVLYQPAAGNTGSAGFHIFTQPLGLESSLVHLWYPALSTAPFIDEHHGTCLGVYGTVEKLISAPSSSSSSSSATPATPLLQISTGHLGSKADLFIDSVQYGGTVPLFIEVKAIQSGTNWGYGIREWSSFGAGTWTTAANYVISPTPQTLTLSTGAASDGSVIAYQISLHWGPTNLGTGTPPTVIDTTQLVNGDTWIFEILPYQVSSIVTGISNSGQSSLVVDASGLKLPSEPNFSCQFDLVYSVSTSGNFFLVQNKSGPFESTLVPAAQYPIDSTTFSASLPSNAAQHLEVTVTGTPVDGDRWTIVRTLFVLHANLNGEKVISNGVVSPVVSGAANSGAWGYPTITGNYGGQRLKVKVICAAANTIPGQVTFIYTATPVDSAGNATGTALQSSFNIVPILSTDGTQLIGWSRYTISVLGESFSFGFDNISGLPSVNDTWIFTLVPSTPAIERISQRPVAAFSQPSSYTSATVIVPTYSAGGRFLQLQIPIQMPVATKATVPTSCALLPLRSTLEPHISTTSAGNTLFFKGLVSPGLSWADGISKEVSTDTTANKKLFGLASYLKTDYRPAHSGIIYSAKIPAGGLSDTTTTGIVSFSTLASTDLITEPQMAAQYVNQLPPADWTVQSTSPPPAYKPTGWFAIFPQYRFRIGQVQVIADIATLLSLNAASVSTTLQSLTVAATGRQVLNETFFVNTMVPVNRTDVFQQYQAAVTDQMSATGNSTWLKPNGTPVNPFENTAFYTSAVYNPAWSSEADFDNNLSKYLMQLMASSVPNMGKCSVMEYGNTRGSDRERLLANKLTSVSNTLTPQYFSTDPIWINTFGSAGGAAACVLLDQRLAPSFQQLTSSDQATLVNAITQSAGSGGTLMLRVIQMYLASQAMLNSTVPLTGVNLVSDIPVSVNPSTPGLPPQQSDITVQTWTAPLTTITILSQGILNIISAAKAKSINIDALIEGLQIALDNRRVAGLPMDSEERFADARGQLAPELQTDLATMIWQTEGLWKENAAKGRAGMANNALNIIVDISSGSVFLASVADKVLHVMTLRSLDTPDTMLVKAVGFSKALKPLEIFSLAAGGLLNVAFGVQSIMGGVSELHGSMILNGRLDISSGALMVTGGAIEIAGAIGGAISGVIVVPGFGEILAGIGMCMSMVKIWVGGAQSVGAFGQALLNIFGKDGGMTELDYTINYIRHVKALAVQAQVSGLVTSVPPISPDPQDDENDTSVPKKPANGIEAKGSPYIIAPFYDVSKLGDTI
ncbi:hypothetical protein GGX14DRAFT_571784 [Mycena pura]|uniref:Uncharacterized protein n=1 Tax=Mycena pura TaxID=153505 RepID=A0AAD6Y7J3_9AGAR|nr:hypothetical protein GGX14DRAFT_571784 [Mycena pura]